MVFKVLNNNDYKTITAKNMKIYKFMKQIIKFKIIDFALQKKIYMESGNSLFHFGIFTKGVA